jgi:hypothetical protein
LEILQNPVLPFDGIGRSLVITLLKLLALAGLRRVDCQDVPMPPMAAPLAAPMIGAAGLPDTFWPTNPPAAAPAAEPPAV